MYKKTSDKQLHTKLSTYFFLPCTKKNIPGTSERMFPTGGNI